MLTPQSSRTGEAPPLLASPLTAPGQGWDLGVPWALRDTDVTHHHADDISADVSHHLDNLGHRREEDVGHHREEDVGHHRKEDVGHHREEDVGHHLADDVGHHHDGNVGHHRGDVNHHPENEAGGCGLEEHTSVPLSLLKEALAPLCLRLAAVEAGLDRLWLRLPLLLMQRAGTKPDGGVARRRRRRRTKGAPPCTVTTPRVSSHRNCTSPLLTTTPSLATRTPSHLTCSLPLTTVTPFLTTKTSSHLTCRSPQATATSFLETRMPYHLTCRLPLATATPSLSMGTSSHLTYMLPLETGMPSLAAGTLSLATSMPSQLTCRLPVATGMPLLATGMPSLATGRPSLATGIRFQATGNTSLALETPSLALEMPSLATGKPCLAMVTSSLALGKSSLATGMPSLATGTLSLATGVPSIATVTSSHLTCRSPLAAGMLQMTSRQCSSNTGEGLHLTEELELEGDEPDKRKRKWSLDGGHLALESPADGGSHLVSGKTGGVSSRQSEELKGFKRRRGCEDITTIVQSNLSIQPQQSGNILLPFGQSQLPLSRCPGQSVSSLDPGQLWPNGAPHNFLFVGDCPVDCCPPVGLSLGTPPSQSEAPSLSQSKTPILLFGSCLSASLSDSCFFKLQSPKGQSLTTVIISPPHISMMTGLWLRPLLALARLSPGAIETATRGLLATTAQRTPFRPLRDLTAPPSLKDDHSYGQCSAPLNSSVRSRSKCAQRQLKRPWAHSLSSANDQVNSQAARQSLASATREHQQKTGEVKRVSEIRIRKSVPKRDAELTPMGLPRPKRLKKKEFSLEEIYTNQNYRSPSNSSLETIFEEPRERGGRVLCMTHQKRPRLLDFSHTPRPRKRRFGPAGSGLVSTATLTSSMRSSALTRRRCRANGGMDGEDEDADVRLVERLSALEDFLSRSGLDEM